MGSFDQLLALQACDTTLDQLRHRQETLPERDQLRAARATLSEVEAPEAGVSGERPEGARLQKRLEDEAAAVEAKAVEVNRKLYSGTITAPKELQAFQEDEASLRRHQATIEDKVLEQMELAEPL